MSGIPESQSIKFSNLFDQSNPENGKLDGQKAKVLLLRSQLSVETLSQVWNLADIDSDGALDRSEFILAMYLAHRCSEGDRLPDTLPRDLVPQDKEQFYFATMARQRIAERNSSFSPTSAGPLAMVPVSTMALAVQPISPSSPVSDPSRHSVSRQLSLSTQFPPWAVMNEELIKSDEVFATIDQDADGLVTGAEVRSVLARSGLQLPVLAQIWDLVDINGSGMLNSEQFAVALHLATKQLAAGTGISCIPEKLPAELYPPSLRPIVPDPNMFEQSELLIAEIKELSRERAEVESSCTQLNVNSQHLLGTTASMQYNVESLSHTARNLATQRTEADKRLAEYEDKRKMLESTLKQMQEQIVGEKSRVVGLREQLSTQESCVKEQEEKTLKFRAELNDLIREEAVLQDRGRNSRKRLQQIEMENKAVQMDIDKASSNVDTLEDKRSQLLEVIGKYKVLLNGENSVEEPAESVVKALLADTHPVSGIVASIHTVNHSRTDDKFNWSTSFSNFDRDAGVTSVPLPEASFSNPWSSQNDDLFKIRHQTTGSVPPQPVFGNDPFQSNSDPFAPWTNEMGKNDPFQDTNTFSFTDPFKNDDPFVTDPFATSSTNQPSASEGSKSSPFDSAFSPSTAPQPTQKLQLTAADFDSVFGPPTTGATFTPNNNDPFSWDAFGNSSQQQTNPPPLSKDDRIEKKFPPPRPKTQPHSSGTYQKNPWASTDPKSFNSHSEASKNIAFATGKKFPSIKNHSLMQRVRRSKRDSDASRHPSNSFSMPSKTDSPYSNPVGSVRSDSDSALYGPGLSEAEQLSIATAESQRLAEEESLARKQEEADLELALRLSKLDN